MSRLLSFLPSYGKDNTVFVEIVKAYEDMYVEGARDILDLYAQFFVKTATWGLDIWEYDLGLKDTKVLSLDQRRSLVLSKLPKRGRIGGKELEDILSLHTKTPSYVYLKEKPAVIVAEIISDQPKLRVEEVLKILDEMKPAHLGIRPVYSTWNKIAYEFDFSNHPFRPKYSGEIVCGQHPYESTRPIEIDSTITVNAALDPSANRLQFPGEASSNEMSLHGYTDLNQDLSVVIDQGSATETPETIIDGGDAHGTDD